MPLLLTKRITAHSAYAVWNITETEQQLLDITPGQAPEGLARKRSEWIATRILAKYLCSSFDIPYHHVENNEHGKPLLVSSNAHISITHSYPLAAVLVNLKEPCGIDLEWPREKLPMIQHKFLHQDEMQFADNIPELCRIWAAKEVLFKVHGREALSFREHIRVKLHEEKGTGEILKPGHEASYELAIEDLQHHVLCYTVARQE